MVRPTMPYGKQVIHSKTGYPESKDHIVYQDATNYWLENANNGTMQGPMVQ